MLRTLAGVLGCILALTLSAQPLMAQEQTQSKLLMVLFFDKNCHAWCDAVRPIVAELKTRYSDRVDFVEIDVSQDKLPETKKIAKDLGIGRFIDAVTDYVPEVCIFTANKRKCITEIVGKKSSDTYEKCLKEALAKGK